MMKKNWKGLFFAVLLLAGLAMFLPTTAKAASPKLSQTKATIYVGEKLKLKVKNAGNAKVTWSSSDPKVAKILSSKKIKGKKEGTATITVKVGKKKLRCEVKVVSALKVYKTELTIKKGKEGKVRCDLLPDNATIGATVANSYICTAKFDQFKGNKTYLRLTPVKNGTTTVYVNNSFNQEVYEIAVTVKGF